MGETRSAIRLFETARGKDHRTPPKNGYHSLTSRHFCGFCIDSKDSRDFLSETNPALTNNYREGKAMGSQAQDSNVQNREFVRLFQQNERKLNGYILSLVPNLAAADEIAQETSIRLWEQFDQYDPGKDFISWACTIAYYQILTYRKTVQREPLRFDSELLEALATRAFTRRDDLDTRQSHLIDCLAQLDEFKRQAIRLYYSLGLTAKAVADRLGRNTAAIEKTITRARHTLHGCIETAIRRENQS